MANEYSNSLIKLTSDYDSIEFINSGSLFVYVDDTLEINDPERDEIRFSSMGYSGSSLKSYTYKSRKIKFSVHILGSNDNAVLDNVSRLRRLLARTTSGFYLAGGAYQFTNTYSSSGFPVTDTGDSGLILQLRLGRDASSVSITTENESNNSNIDPMMYTRVLSAVLTLDGAKYSVGRTITRSGTTYKYREYSLELECEPYFHQRPRQISKVNAPGLYSGPVSPSNANVNRIFITGTNILGSEPAPTRIMTQLTGATGILIGRDAGYSMVNCPSYPVFSGSGRNDLYVTGDTRSTTGKIYKVKVVGTGTPNTFQYSEDNGSSWSSNQNMSTTAWTQIGSNNVYVKFETTSSHTINDTWTFHSHQVIQTVTQTTDVYTNRATVYGEDGMNCKSIYFNVPYGCHSRYKVYVVYSTTGFTPEFQARIFHGGYAASYVNKLFSGGTKLDWIQPSSTTTADVAIIDLSGNALPGYQHPSSSGEIRIDLHVRANGTISNPASITVDYVYLIPCPDENSWFHAAWTDDGDEYEHFCNYDMSNPYMVETIAPTTGSYRRIMPLNGTYGGDFITLIPGIDNTIVMIPIFSTDTDWRKSQIPVGSSTGLTSISYKPRFLNP